METVIPVQTRLCPKDVGCPELARALQATLTFDDPLQMAKKRFREQMADVIRGIRSHGRFDFLKRFISHGSLLPEWETKFKNSPRALDDEELAAVVNFISGHMVSKFQGKLAEILAEASLRKLILRLQKDGDLPVSGRFVPGGLIRCRPRQDSRNSGFQGMQGPDALFIALEKQSIVRVHAVAEIKSMPVRLHRLRLQSQGHLSSLARGVKIENTWYGEKQVRFGSAARLDPARVVQIFVRPSTWLLTRQFRFEPTEKGRKLVMAEQKLPTQTSTMKQIDKYEWLVELDWSRDALRAAAFLLAHRYMSEVGEALASAPDPDVALRTDMSPGEAGENDLLHQLHVAIVRQADSEPDPRRRNKTIELYNVLAFGWALGHAFRGPDGRPDMMYPEDLDCLCATPK